MPPGGRSSIWLYIDVAGSDDLNKRIKTHFSSPYTGVLSAFIVLGMTKLSPRSKNIDSDENPFGISTTVNDIRSGRFTVEQFFMPEWLEVRRHQIPIMEIFSRQNQAWKDLMVDCTKWVELERAYGPAGVKEAYGRLAKEGLGPDKGLIWSLWDDEKKLSRTVVSRL